MDASTSGVLDASPTPDDTVRSAAAGRGLRTEWQPIVDLQTGQRVAFEALSRGPAGSPLERPDALFAAARRTGLLAELDGACRSAALRSAARLGLTEPWTVFVNTEPEVITSAPLEELRAMAGTGAGRVQVVLELTERAVTSRPAELLRAVARVRELGWGIALDDVGAQTASLTFLGLLQPDVVKLDLSLVQDRAGSATAEVMHAVNSYAEATGATVLAEGIETPRHLQAARALGATLGQGWLFGRPEALPLLDAAGPRTVPLLSTVSADDLSASSPFSALPAGTPLRRSPKRLLVELSKTLERQAASVGPTCLLVSTFQHAHQFTAATARRYTELADRVGFVAVLGDGLHDTGVAGVRTGVLPPGDPVLGEWDVVVLGPHFSAALLARDLGETGPEMDRTFEHALTYQRHTVARAAHGLLTRVGAQVG